jgi:release factor glutamine methyltransferase
VASSAVRDALHAAATELGGATARLDAELLLAHCLAVPRAWLYAHDRDPVPEAVHARLRRLVERRRHGEPLAYLLGQREFWSLSLEVTRDTLIPRPETELLVETALELLPAGRACRVLDLGTGSGAIALALASERPVWRLLAVDRAPAALAVARRNRERLGLSRVALVAADWCQAFGAAQFDAVVANPPYVADDDPGLVGELRFEPRAALAAGADGLDDLRRIVAAAAPRLAAGGWLLLEHGAMQAGAVRALLGEAGFEAVSTRRDLADLERVTLGRWCPAGAS